MSQNPSLSAPMRLLTQTVLALFCLAQSLHGQIETNRPTRPMTLDQAIKLALENNLQIARARFEPQLASFRLTGSYGFYDPVFEGFANHSYRQREGRFNAETGITPSSTTESDVFGGGIA